MLPLVVNIGAGEFVRFFTNVICLKGNQIETMIFRFFGLPLFGDELKHRSEVAMGKRQHIVCWLILKRNLPNERKQKRATGLREIWKCKVSLFV